MQNKNTRERRGIMADSFFKKSTPFDIGARSAFLHVRGVCEKDPLWLTVEPTLLKIWAEGIRKASYLKLYTIHLLTLFISMVQLLWGFVIRILLFGILLFLGWTIFGDPIILSIKAVFPSLKLFSNEISILAKDNNLWIYHLLGYLILIKSLLLIFGKYFVDCLQELILCLFMLVTGCVFLKWKPETVYQYSPIMSRVMAQYASTIIVAGPSEIEQQYLNILELYQKHRGWNVQGINKELEVLVTSQ